MVQPPSKQLQQVLLGQRLCTQRDLKRCVAHVRRLSGDLPAFDSVWLDALVQSRCLTAFQVRAVETGQLDQLRIGPCVLLDRCGHGPSSETFLARHTETRALCIIKRVALPTELKGSVLERMQALVQTGKSLAHPGIVVPQACSELPEEALPAKARPAGGRSALSVTTRLAVVSRLVHGIPVGSILLTRGRMAPKAVAGIARQTLEALQSLHAAGLVHGEINLRNLLLDRHGQAVLVDAGIAPALQPEFQINAFADPQRYDGIAPELIGTGEPATIRSDLYALGCLLWHLLAGRPVWPTGDPLARLAAHQTERIPDIREIAPETPAALAESILWMTEPDPRRRPRSVQEVLTGRSEPVAPEPSDGRSESVRQQVARSKAAARLPTEPAIRRTPGLSVSPSRSTLVGLARSFHQPVTARRTAHPGRSRMVRATVAALAVLLLTAGTLTALNGRARNLVLASLRAGRPVSIDEAAAPAAAQPAALPAAPMVTGPMALPEPDALGVIDLPDTGPWLAKRIAWPGSRLTLRSSSGTPARVLIDSSPLMIEAAEIILENIELELREQNPAGSTTASLAVIRSQLLSVRNCAFLSEPGMPGEDLPGHAFEWEPLSVDDPLAGRVDVIDSRLVGSHSTIALAGRGHRLRCVNTLKAGGGPLVLLKNFGHPVEHSVLLQNSTIRASSGLIAAELLPGGQWQSQLKLALVASVIDLNQGKSGVSESLLEFRGRSIPAAWYETVTVSGQDSITRAGLNIAGGRSPDGRQRRVLKADRLSVSGLFPAEFSWRGPLTERFRDSELTGLRTSPALPASPGIRPAATSP